MGKGSRAAPSPRISRGEGWGEGQPSPLSPFFMGRALGWGARVCSQAPSPLEAHVEGIALGLPLTLTLSPQSGGGETRAAHLAGRATLPGVTMAELLLELFSEEIPARMQGRAAEDLKRLVTDGLKAQGLEAGEAKAYATPRRLTLMVEGVPAQSPDIAEERKGPRVNAPEQAIAGFVKSAGLRSIKDAEIVKDDKKGDFYVVKIEKPGGRPRRSWLSWCRPWRRSSLAEGDALGLGQVHLGAAAPLHRLPARRQDRAVRHRGRGGGALDARAPLLRQRAVRHQRRGGLRQGAQEATR